MFSVSTVFKYSLSFLISFTYLVTSFLNSLIFNDFINSLFKVNELDKFLAVWITNLYLLEETSVSCL
ncbi:hypothetical protein NWE60_02490 [Mycoplasmopsis felis]|uniref:hypothetical protein n=1 Tax=Mycoplasmopsis felis TaxID=33923 RepID=UPI0021E04307|nr:hypothetical protein [Mycoplasmopsis felis]MCU9939021.1 hypothetical protein [Mycoplasmopsis felis]WAM01465.1 hypothetical protein NWE60_02490 [Mycoplasmopsis felis]